MEFHALLPLLCVIICNIGYHVSSKNINSTINPLFSLVITYGISLVVSVLIYFGTSSTSLASEISKLSLSSVLMGAAIVGVEGGYILLYRSGWQLSTAALIISLSMSIVLLLIGTFFYHEPLSMKKALGMLCCILGIFLLHH